jgi:hypothetical protein
MASGTPARRTVLTKVGQVSISVTSTQRGRTRASSRRTAKPASTGV